MSETTADATTAHSTGQVLAAVDAGATKTVALAVTPDGEQLGRAEGEGANPKRHGLDVAADRIAAVAIAAVQVAAGAVILEGGAAEVAETAAAEAAAAEAVAAEAATEVPGAGATGIPGLEREPALLFVAGAGIDRPEHARALEAALAARLPRTRVHVVNDTMAVLRAGTPDGVGLVVPVSTGGNVIGRAADGRVTDRGHGIFGGGYVLGALAARAVRRDGTVGSSTAGRVAGAAGAAGGSGGTAGGYDGRSTGDSGGGGDGRPKSMGSVGPELRAQVEAAHLGWRGRRPAPEAALLGAAVVAAAQAGDPYPARMVARWCGRVEAAVREETERLDLGPNPVVILYGGLLEASPWLEGQLGDAVRAGVPGARIQRLDVEPVAGVVLLARDAWAGRPVRWDFIPRR